ncbi:MAG: bifunctional DNA-formamidopyrimidine glycosylase/DNA-(apurinic or apyrimidinic site) lyase [Planctomycetes bacterium]|nr:bifunctional DNA-formamidopyrimidine glycosylase/DNA-(apurinic or apyrimidinic site) lyase [Planctomycetota bacterium]
MPELPEVETIIRGLRPTADGATIEAVTILRADVIHAGRSAIRAALPGRRIQSLGREGKRILFNIDSGALLVIHLGMSGRLTLEPTDAPLAKHTHFRIGLKDSVNEIRFRDPRRFGGVWFFPTAADAAQSGIKPLGPDALTIRVPVLRELARRKRQIKALLLDQYAISGLGNIYCDEALFSSHIHPLTPATALSESQIRNLACSIRKTLNASLNSGGSTLMDYRTADGNEGRFQRLFRVYDREGEPCRRCGKIIERIIAAGRSTHFCPKCQRL